MPESFSCFSLIALEELADFLNVENGKPNMKPKAGGSNMDTMWDNADLFTTKSKPTSKWVNNMKVDPDFFGDDRKRNSRMVWRGHKEKKNIFQYIIKSRVISLTPCKTREWNGGQMRQNNIILFHNVVKE